MVAFPAAGAVENAGNTVPTQKATFEAWLAATKQLPGGQADSELTIAAGAVTPTRFLHRVDTEADAAADNLDNILQDNLPDGSLLKLVPENAARVVTLRHQTGGAGELVLTNGENFALDDAGRWIRLRRKGAQWIEVLRSTVFGRRIGGAADAAAVRALIDGQQATGSLTENTGPALTDFFAGTVGGNHRKVQLINMFNRITAATALTAIAIDDEIFIYDLSATIAKKITPVELLKVVNALTEDAAPDKANDFVLTYDASAGTVKKVKPNNLSSPSGLIPIERKTGAGVASYDFTTGIDGTYRSYLLKGRLLPATDDTELWLRTDSNGGASFDAGAGEYEYAASGNYVSVANDGNSSTSDTKILLSSATTNRKISNVAGEGGISFEIKFEAPSAAKYQHFLFHTIYDAATTGQRNSHGGGARRASAAINALQLLFNSGNIASGDVTLYGVANA